MSETRREHLVRIAGAVSLAGMTPAAAQHVHDAAAAGQKAAGGVYKPKCLTAHEFRTLEVLCEEIVPGARQGGAAPFIDLLCSNNKELAAIYTGGLAWLDRAMEKRANANFAGAPAAEQTALLDLIAFRRNSNEELAPGIRFFDWARRMTVDAYYTSPAGIKELGFQGNGAVGRFEVPKEIVDDVLRKSGLA